MTTETPKILLRVAGLTLVAGLLAAALGGVVSGSPAAYGALAGAVVSLAVFVSGTFVVNAVAQVLPAAALLVAVLTYTLQVVVMALVFVAVTGSGLLESDLDRRWLGGTVIAATVTWLGAQLWLTSRARIPAYDLGREGGEG